MEILFNPDTKDIWNYIENKNTLLYHFSYHGKQHRNISYYKVAFSGKGFPFLFTKSDKQLRCYRWSLQTNQWKSKTLSSEYKDFSNIFIAQENNGTSHLIIADNHNISRYNHIFYLTQSQRWTERLITLPKNVSIINTTYLSKESKLLLNTFDKKTRVLHTYTWQNNKLEWVRNPAEITIHTGLPLKIEYTPKKVYILTLSKDFYYKITYYELNHSGKLLKVSQFMLLPSFFPKSTLLIKEGKNIAVIFPNSSCNTLFFSEDGHSWKELAINPIFSSKKIGNVCFTTGYISSKLAVNEICGVTLKSPVILNLSQVLELLELKK